MHWRKGSIATWLTWSILCTFSNSELVREFTVSEGAPVGTHVGYIGDELPDASPPYTIVPVPSSQVDTDLHVDHNTGEIKIKAPLDRERRDSYSLIAIPATGDNVRVLIKVLDENDNPPTFPSSFMKVEFSENTPRDVKRKLNPAKDMDIGIYNTQRYEIVSGNSENAFRLSSHRERDGVLYLDLQINGMLDRETVDSYQLVIEAFDGGTPPLKGTMTVNITILDVNDNHPVFAESSYSASIPENATVGSFVLKVFATDSDSGDNGLIEYSINRRQSDRGQMFEIDADSGEITVNKPLDYETKELHDLVVVARDKGLQPLETTCFVTIRVTDVNDNKPTIDVIFLSDDATPKISEAARPGEFVARISVHDPDSKTDYSNANVTLNGGDGRFELQTRDNVIYLVVAYMSLDREEKPEYILNILAKDTGIPPLHASRDIKLQVTDVNDNPPVFGEREYKAVVPEAASPGTPVVQVSASDLDIGDNAEIRYSIQPSPQAEWFSIDSRSGLVTTRSKVDCETNSMPRLTVVAEDRGKPSLSATALLFITVLDVNDNEPVFDQSFYNVTVAENEAVGHCLLKVSATDPDCGVNSIVNYTTGDAFGPIDKFTISAETGELCIRQLLDYETRSVYEVPIVATDRGGLSTTAIVKVQLIDVNDNIPTFTSHEYNVTLRIGKISPSEPILTVSATDPDSGRFGQISYSLVSGDRGNLFRVDRSGSVFINNPAQLRASSKYSLEVSASDGGGKSATRSALVYISVLDNDSIVAPFEKSRYNFTVSEDSPLGTLVGRLRTTLDSQHMIQYSILSGDPDNQFSVDPTTGSIRIKKALDWENKKEYLLAVRAVSGSPSVYDHTQVAITVVDVNDNAPKFEASVVRVSVSESLIKGATIYAAHAKDIDGGVRGRITYSIKPQKSNMFEIHPETGIITLKGTLDYETSTKHSIVIEARDGGNPPLSGSLTLVVDVQDANDNSPHFERSVYRISVLESEAPGTEIVELKAFDSDSGNNARITYKILNTDGPFRIESTSGRIYLLSSLDREKVESHKITVTAHDNGTPQMTATATAIIEVADVNDNAAVWSKPSYTFSIVEGLNAGTRVGALSAVDADIGDNAVVHYSLLPPHYEFTMNPTTGEIFTRSSLDREVKSVYNLIAEARDQGTPSRASRVTVFVKVNDINDNAPEIIDPKEDVVSVREEQPPGAEVARIKAIDKDEGENSSISYGILEKSSDGQDAFSIDSLTGIIRTKIVLDHDEHSIYRLSVYATDNGNPPKQTIRQLKVEVLDLNDNRPTFTSSSLSFRVKENAAVGVIVAKIACCDNNISENLISSPAGRYVSYTLITHSDDIFPGSFDIDRRSGSLIVARPLDREIQDEFRLEVRALDTSSSNNPQSSAISIKIEIVDINDNAPVFSDDPITVNIKEDAIVGTSVANLTATDADIGVNAEITYSLISTTPTHSEIFVIDSFTGIVTLQGTLDFEEVNEYFLVVRASDKGNDTEGIMWSDVTVRILVVDCNDNAPIFVSPNEITIPLLKNEMDQILYHVLATDKDSDENGKISYMFSGGNRNGYFTIDHKNGQLRFSTDYLSNNKKIKTAAYELNITAVDHGLPYQKRSHMLLRMTITESKESSLKFLEPFYKVNVSEDAVIGSLLLNLRTARKSNRKDDFSYIIPERLVDDTFLIDERQGTITTKAFLDREKRDSYTFPVYVMERTPSHLYYYDSTTIIVSVQDINDNAPVFQRRSCYPLSVPENNQVDVIHTVVARDIDIGSNGLVTYSITGGNIGNKFFIDSKSGRLTCRSLDFEVQQKYVLTITAHDHGLLHSLQASCNITINVEDENDIDPVFESTQYVASIPEDTIIGTSVIRVRATYNGIVKSTIIYSLVNETEWLFTIHNETGIISTTGPFDREKKSVYNFMVIAIDLTGNFVRSTKVPIEINIEDVNDNNPVFVQYPFRARIPVLFQAGQSILSVEANDKDIGINSEILYELENSANHKFKIDPTTGILTTTQSIVNEKGKLLRLKVIAKDKGNPPKSSKGLIEVVVGELPQGMPTLKFKDSSYNINIAENYPEDKEILQVTAVRSDGRRQTIIYDLENDQNSTFSIDSNSGIIRIRNSSNLDYETNTRHTLVISARTENYPILYGYCEVFVNLIDQNDNAPKFTQQEYIASIFEGNSKGEFVMQLSAKDDDEGSNARILYHIVDGNHDNAFIIEPAFSAIVRTNIVLDREIRDSYKLTVIATDSGVPQLTGSASIRIKVIDINDNRPTFPPRRIISVPEDISVGTVLTALSANDVDLHPHLIYTIVRGDDLFTIDRYSGKIVLVKPLDYETEKEYTLNVTAFDGEFTAETTLAIKVTDVNDHSPTFSQNSYYFNLPASEGTIEIGFVKATDDDSGENGRISYFLLQTEPGYYIDEVNGRVYANFSELSNPKKDAQLVVEAKDHGKNPKSSLCAVRLVSESKSFTKSLIGQDKFRITIHENETLGKSLLQIGKYSDETNLHYYISSGNIDDNFEITATGSLILVKRLDRETRDSYTLYLNTIDQINSQSLNLNLSAVTVYITIADVNDNAPVFNMTNYHFVVSEYSKIGETITQISTQDYDSQINSVIRYSITSGNKKQTFSINPVNGILSVNNTLDYDTNEHSFNIIVCACDSGSPQLCTLQNIKISLQDENDNSPIFPVTEYYATVAENEIIGTSVFTARAIDLDRGQYGNLTYSITSALPVEFIANDDSWKMFNIDTHSGLVTTNSIFDYEKRNKYSFTVRTSDSGGKTATVQVKVEVDSKDEYYPQFTQKTYNFIMVPPSSSSLSSGYVVGQVTATDRDKGPDGRVVYQLSNANSFFKINRSTGVIMLKKHIENQILLKKKDSFSLVIIANSGKPTSLTNKTAVEITLDPLAILNDQNETTTAATNGMSDWALGLVIALLLIIMSFGGIYLFLHMKNKRHKKINKPGLNSEGHGNSNSYVDPSAFDTMPIRNSGETNVSSGQFAPPKYDEIPPYGPHAPSSNSNAPATSEISGSDRSGSSGRGSAEDGDEGEDEEIRAINERPLRRDVNEDDDLSDVSVHNTQEYLARLGIIEGASSGTDERSQRRNYRDDADITNLIYAKLNDVTCPSDRSEADEVGAVVERAMALGSFTSNPGEPAPARGPSMTGSLSSIVHSEEELTGSYNWDYLLDWGPRYQPLAHVFSEIARLKDDAASTRSGDSSRGGVNSTRSTAPPPLLTSVAAMRCAAPTLGTLPEPVTPFSAAAAMCPSFSPSLSPLATRSPSISPLVAPGLPGMMTRHKQLSNHPVQDTTLRI